jgi:hypothetical protein
MNPYKRVIDAVEPQFKVLLKYAERQGNSEIRISAAVAREILVYIRDANKQIEKSKSKHIRLKREPAWLDNPF